MEKKQYHLTEVNDSVTRLIAEHYGTKGQEMPAYTAGDSLTEKLGFDSLDMVELIMACEDEFEIRIPDEALGEKDSQAALVTAVVNGLEDRMVLPRHVPFIVGQDKGPLDDGSPHPLNFGQMSYDASSVKVPAVAGEAGHAYKRLDIPWEHFGLTPIAMCEDSFTQGWFYFNERKQITDHIVSTQPLDAVVDPLALVGELAVKTEVYCTNAGLPREAISWYAGKVRTGLITGGDTKEYWIVEAFVNGHRAGDVMWEINPAATILLFLDKGTLRMRQEITALFRKPATVGLDWSQP